MMKWTAAAATTMIGAGLLVPATGLAGLGTKASAGVPVAPAPATFSHAVPTDQQKEGNEPDILVDHDGRIFSSVPFGFSTTQSFIWNSLDNGNSFQLAPGNIGGSKPSTCAGGGDTDLATDAGGENLYFSDLQGLTNISNSVSQDHGATWSTNCAGAPNAPVDRMWFAHSGDLSKHTLNLFQDYDAIHSNTSANNVLVETLSTDGQTFVPVTNTNPDPNCGAGIVDCVTPDEGISGNQVVDPGSGNVFITHTDSTSSKVLVERGVITPGPPPTATWTKSPVLNGALCPDATCIDTSGSSPEPEMSAGVNFSQIAEDSAHHFYVVFAAAPLNHNASDPNVGANTAPEQIYVVSSSDGNTWSVPKQLTTTGTNVFPWLVAGDGGRVDVAWYHTDSVSEPGTCQSGSGTCTLFGAANLHHAEWDVRMAQSLNADSASPVYTQSLVSEHPVKFGEICTNGLGCTTGGDRSLGDFMQITIDGKGAAEVVYVDDTSNNENGGEATGLAVVSHQIGGSSLLTATPTVNGPGTGPGVPTGSVADPTGDAAYPANGAVTPASANLDLTGAGISTMPNGDLQVTIHAKDLSSLATNPNEGGGDASWILRWEQVTPGVPGNGHIYYAGMESDGGAAPTFFDGDASCIATTHCKYLTYPQTNAIQGTYNPATGLITMDVPLKDVGNPVTGTTLYSAMAFSATSTTPQSASTLFNLIDATTPFNATVAFNPANPGSAGCTAGQGYWLDASDGGMFSFGSAQFFGSTGGMHLNKPMVGMSPTIDCKGYWLDASDGGIFSFGDAQFYGSTGSIRLNQPVVGMAATPTGKGYWLVASDGGIFSFGDATFWGSTGNIRLNKPIVGMAPTPTGKGYWLVASDGGIFSFGDAAFHGSTGAMHLNAPIVGMAATPSGAGYWLVATDGGIFSFGDAAFHGSTGNMRLNQPIVGMAATITGQGYWLVASDGGIFAFPDAVFFGSTGGIRLNRPVVGMARSG